MTASWLHTEICIYMDNRLRCINRRSAGSFFYRGLRSGLGGEDGQQAASA